MSGTVGQPWQRFPAETLRRLFDAVEVNDAVDAHVALPQPIRLACTESGMRQCYALCLQFFEDGAQRRELLRLVKKTLRNEPLDADERLHYKYMRARCKHLRFAQRLYSRDHEFDKLFDRMTRALGTLQDAFRSGRHENKGRPGRKLRFLLSPPMWAVIRWRMRRTRLDSEAGLVRFQKAQIRQLREALAQETFVGEDFHSMRKIVSMQVSYYDTVRTIEHDDHAFRMSRFLAAINGLMGSRHDEMVTDNLSGRRDYDTPAPLAKEIRQRLETLVAQYPQ